MDPQKKVDAPVAVTPERVEKILAFWIPRLGLADWDIRWTIVTPGQIDGDHAKADFCTTSKRALIQLREVQDSLQDFHDTVIHELLHMTLWWADTNTDQLQGIVLEHSMRWITVGLTELSLLSLEES